MCYVAVVDSYLSKETMKVITSSSSSSSSSFNEELSKRNLYNRENTKFEAGINNEWVK